MIKVVRRGSREAGGCNFCNRYMTAHGEKDHVVTEVSPESGGGVYVRFCDACLVELKGQIK